MTGIRARKLQGKGAMWLMTVLAAVNCTIRRISQSAHSLLFCLLQAVLPVMLAAFQVRKRASGASCCAALMRKFRGWNAHAAS